MRPSCLPSLLRTLVFSALLYLFSSTPAHAQAPYLYASIPNGATSQVVGFSVALDGTLVPVAGSPFSVSHEVGLITTDPLDQFLFELNANSNLISVLAIDPASGALAELSVSPVPTPTAVPGSGGTTPSEPVCMATFQSPSASYLYVAYRSSSTPASASSGYGAIVEFQIGTAAAPLTPNFSERPQCHPNQHRH